VPWLCDVIAICLHAAVAAIRLFKLLFSRKCKYGFKTKLERERAKKMGLFLD